MLDTVDFNHVQHISFTQSCPTDAVSVILSELLSYEHPSKEAGIVSLLFSADLLRGGLVVTLGHAADLAGSGVLMDDTLALGRVNGGDSGLDDGGFVRSVAVDGSVCLLDHCFQVGLDGLIVQSLFLGLDNAVLLRFNVRHSFHLLGSP